MRTAYIQTLTELAEKRQDIFLLTGDLGFSVFEKFEEAFPGRFYDIGVAEQNMIGVAAGLALSGKIVFVYSIIPFAIMRCLEQIRNDLCMQNLNVKIIGMGAGLHYGAAGPTHHAIEDIALMRALPNMTVVSPSTPKETEYMIRAAVDHAGPMYIRLGNSLGNLKSYDQNKFCLGKGVLIEDGDELTICSTGSILYYANEVMMDLKKIGLSVRLINIHTIKPIDKDIILKSAKETKAIFTIEEHSVLGGLGSTVAEILAESKCDVYFKRIALSDSFIEDVGSRKYLLEKNSLSPAKIKKIILKEVENINGKKTAKSNIIQS